MAKSVGVWGIEIGQSALKALCCRREGDEVVATAFDFIEYPKLLSQPEAEPEQLISEALDQFLERNETKGYDIAISVPGQSGLAKFFKPPPVEAKKIGDIVKYEARQQIPFELNDVVWDYQLMPGSQIEEGFALETEVGLFAMKREQAYRQLKPFTDKGIEVDLVQLAPLALYNMVTVDRLHERLELEAFDPDNPPPSTVMLALGTDSTDLIVTNGFRVWQRSMPIGGNHFTRALTKELKLTFAKAEHLKRNAAQSEDPKLVFQTMRPVFSDLVTEVQRSIGFFQNLHRQAQIEQLLVTGNVVKLPGLASYLGKNLGYDVHVVDSFQRLSGDDVVAAPTFKDNIYSFGVCYGLCLQGLGRGPIHTSLVPREILTERLIRAKKPWALAGAAALMLGMVGHYFFTERIWASVHESRWQQAQVEADQTAGVSRTHTAKDSELTGKLAYLDKVGNELSANSERRLLWLELMKSISHVLSHSRHPDYPTGLYPSVDQFPLQTRKDIQITKIETELKEDVATGWFTALQSRWQIQLRDWMAIKKLKELPPELAEKPAPEGPGWIIELTGYHYYNSKVGEEGANHVIKYLIDHLMHDRIVLPGPNGQMLDFTMQEMGIDYPIISYSSDPTVVQVPNPDYEPPADATATGGLGGYGGYGMEAEEGYSEGYDGGYGEDEGYGAPAVVAQPEEPEEPEVEPLLETKRHDFVVQFLWKPTLLSERVELREARLEAEQQAREEAAQEAAASDDVAANIN